MKLIVQHQHVRSTDELDSWIEERIFALQARLSIDEANVRLARQPDRSPAFSARVHLLTPGPALVAEGSDHTLRAAIDRVLAELETLVGERARPQGRRIRGHRQWPPARRSGRDRC